MLLLLLLLLPLLVLPTADKTLPPISSRLNESIIHCAPLTREKSALLTTEKKSCLLQQK